MRDLFISFIQMLIRNFFVLVYWLFCSLKIFRRIHSILSVWKYDNNITAQQNYMQFVEEVIVASLAIGLLLNNYNFWPILYGHCLFLLPIPNLF